MYQRKLVYTERYSSRRENERSFTFTFQYTISIGLDLDTNATDRDNVLHIWNAEQQFKKGTEQKSIRAHILIIVMTNLV